MGDGSISYAPRRMAGRRMRGDRAERLRTMRSPPPITASSPGLLLPVPGIVMLAVTIYLVLVLMVVVVRQWLLARGSCAECSACAEGEPGPGSEWALALAQTCDCWVPTLTQCLDHCCPRGQDCHCRMCLPCGTAPLCDCACAFQLPDCESINCICFEIRLR